MDDALLVPEVHRAADLEEELQAFDESEAHANRVVREGLRFRERFLVVLKNDYGAPLARVDFNQPEQARERINGWVEEQTNDRIKDLIPAGALDEYTRLVLTNAIYFKGQWSVPFEESNTKDRDFTLSGGDKTPTPIMHAPKLKVGRYGSPHVERIRIGHHPEENPPSIYVVLDLTTDRAKVRETWLEGDTFRVAIDTQ